ncbi:glycoside hydrolase family 16 [Trichoderma arundinaceum]|uniref:Glycoside hydrolase family 16 n=1 Tax=Trichoderma arundinaceum TaxID=490622 RepID=A0A395NPK2_TRIAR|nr:glycoside hydrolase family 16 [Trichoderma arundinaceum]
MPLKATTAWFGLPDGVWPEREFHLFVKSPFPAQGVVFLSLLLTSHPFPSSTTLRSSWVRMAYNLTTSYAGEALLSGFNWFDGIDPSHGFVSHNAQEMGLYSIDERSGVVRIGVDSTHKYSTQDQGRPSIRIESKQTYDHGLFIADFLHMPPSHCGLWPAFWTYGDNWPYDGEIDIIEGVNTAHTNIISAHTADGCTQDASINGLFSGRQLNTQCAVGNENIGCGFNPRADDTSSYGDGFNAAHGGVYAMEWDPVHIRIWHFPRGSIPRDIERKRPRPETWGQPIAIFGGSSCDVNRYFHNMRLVLNINFCGDYGNAVWGKSDQCNEFASTCSEYVARNPEAFTNAYWDVRYIDAYEFHSGAHNPRPHRPGRPGRPDWEDERTTTTTKTTRSTETVTVYATGHHPHGPYGPHGPYANVSIPTAAAIEPVATTAPVNPQKIKGHSYLGCFYSTSNFKTFKEVANNKDMTLERCVDLCGKKSYAGIFDTHCFCSEHLDARTRAANKEGICKQACPGNSREYCGGTVAPKGGDAPHDKSATASSPPYALTVYGYFVGERPKDPPAMAPGSNEAYRPPKVFSQTVTEVAEVTVFPISEDDARRKGWEQHDWNKHEGDKHNGDEHQDDGKESNSWTFQKEGEEGKWAPAKPKVSEAVVTATATDCPEKISTKEAVVIPTWLPPVDPKLWDPADPPSPPHTDGDDHRLPPPPPPPSSPGLPVNTPVVIAAAPRNYEGIEKYLAILGLSILAIAAGVL